MKFTVTVFGLFVNLFFSESVLGLTIPVKNLYELKKKKHKMYNINFRGHYKKSYLDKISGKNLQDNANDKKVYEPLHSFSYKKRKGNKINSFLEIGTFLNNKRFKISVRFLECGAPGHTGNSWIW